MSDCLYLEHTRGGEMTPDNLKQMKRKRKKSSAKHENEKELKLHEVPRLLTRAAPLRSIIAFFCEKGAIKIIGGGRK